jgi:hypothetical protein
MCAEEEDEEDLDDGELSAHKFASQLIDMVTTKLPDKHTFQPAMEMIQHYVNDASPHKRRAGITVLSVSFLGVF